VNKLWYIPGDEGCGRFIEIVYVVSEKLQVFLDGRRAIP